MLPRYCILSGKGTYCRYPFGEIQSPKAHFLTDPFKGMRFKKGAVQMVALTSLALHPSFHAVAEKTTESDDPAPSFYCPFLQSGIV